jgi:DNA-binding MarR family transcriptional regulator
VPIHSSSTRGAAGVTHRGKRSDAVEILDHFRRIVQALRESSRASEAQLGVSGAQLFVLQTLEKNEPLSLNALAELTHTHQSTVSVVVRRLVKQQLLQSLPAPGDRRRLELSLSTRGRALLRRAPAAVQDRLVAGVYALSPVQRKSLAGSLGKLARAMGLATGAPAMFFEEKKHAARGRTRVQR